MQDRLQIRLAELRAELTTGERMLEQLHSQQRHLERNLLRIGGAVKVIEELLADLESEPTRAQPTRASAAQGVA